jgi:hypothetical protein
MRQVNEWIEAVKDQPSRTWAACAVQKMKR